MTTLLNMNTYALSAAIVFALSACGGGGGGGMVRSPVPAAPPSAPPPPPPPTALGPCPMPIAGDCAVNSPGTMLGGRTATGKLVLHVGNHPLIFNPDLVLGREANPDIPGTQRDLAQATYTFIGGTTITSGWLQIYPHNTLVSDVAVVGPIDVAKLEVGGRLVGSVDNAGSTTVLGTLEGNVSNLGKLHNNGSILGNVENDGLFTAQGTVTGMVRNNGVLGVAGDVNGTALRFGHFSQSGSAVMAFTFATTGSVSTSPLWVTGRADLAGTLELRYHEQDGWGYYPLPAAGSHWLIHAEGGVFGTFDRWTSPGLFIEGALRYAPNDVWFDLTKISVQAGATANALGSGVTLASAANFDRAFAGAGSFGGQASASQLAFNASAGKLVWMSDTAQATRAIDSLSGAIHADALQSTGDAVSARTVLGAHLDLVVPGKRLGAWTHEDGYGVISGVDQWLEPNLLAGVHASRNAASDAASASANDLGSGGYLRWFGNDGWYAGLDAGITHRDLAVGRSIDFGNAGQWSVRSRRPMDAVSASIEAGKRLPLLGGSLTPFLGAGVTSVQAAATSEQGTSGFELQLADSRLRGNRASAGLRFARDWRWGDSGWLQLNAAAGIDHTGWSGHPQAAFLGVPDVWFNLPASIAGRQRWASFGVQGGWGHGWAWSASRASGRWFGETHPWSLTLRRDW